LPYTIPFQFLSYGKLEEFHVTPVELYAANAVPLDNATNAFPPAAKVF